MLEGTLDERFDAALTHFREAMDAARGVGMTEPDPETGEQWDLVHILAHVSEMLEYWLAEVLHVLASESEVPFGRLKRSPERIARIEQRAMLTVEELRSEINLRAEATSDLCRLLRPEQLRKKGIHPKFGAMTVEEIVTEFGVDHLHEHAGQLELL